MGSRIMEFVAFITDSLVEIWSSFQSPPPQHCPPSLGGGDLETGGPPVEPMVGRDNALNWAKIMVAFCLTAALEVPLVYAQVYSQLPPGFTLFSLAVLLAFACFFVGDCIKSIFVNLAKVLEKLGIVLTFTSVFLIATISFRFYFKIISWVVYSISVAAIFVSHFFK